MRPRIVLFAAISLLLAALFVRLGFWQYSRHQARVATNARAEARLALPERPLAEVLRAGGDIRYRRVVVDDAGADTSRELVLQSRTRNGSPGVHFLRPVPVGAGDTLVIVNRGWAYSPDGMTVDRAKFAEPAERRFVGYLDSIPNYGGRLANAASSDPRRVARMDGALLAKRLGAPIAPYYVAVTGPQASSPDGPARLDVPRLDDTGPHFGYALQWWAFAAIALVGTGIVAARESRKGGRRSAGADG